MGIWQQITWRWNGHRFLDFTASGSGDPGVKVSVAYPSLVCTNIADRTTYLKVSKEDYLKRLPRAS